MPQANVTGRKPIGGSIKIPSRIYGECEVRANTLQEDDRTVEIIWAAGASVKRYSYDEGFYLEALSMTPAAIRMDRFTNGMSVLDGHDAHSMTSRLGTVVPGSVRISGGKAYARVRLSRNKAGEDLFQDLVDGHPFPVSVGYKIHAYERTEAAEGQLPVLTAVDWEPMELSAVPIPADAGASSRSHDRDNAVTVAVTPRDRNAATYGDSDMPQPNVTGRKPAQMNTPRIETRGRQDEVTTRREMVANAMLHRAGVHTTLADGAREWRDMSLMDTAKELMWARGESTRGPLNQVLDRALHSTSDFPAILGDVTRQTLVAGYTGYENTFQLFANRNVVSDFREVKAIEVGSGPGLMPINEHGEFKRGTLTESAEGFKIGTFGRIVGMTRQMIINDQLGAFTRVIQGWGRKAAELEGDIVWAAILDNMKLKDGKGLFHADHGNIGTPAALGLDALKAARTMFRKQTDIDGTPINVSPAYLIVGSDLEIDAQTILTGPTNAQNVSVIVPDAIKSLTPIYEYRIDQFGENAWFLFADQVATMGRGVQYAFLSGQEQPFTDERIGFEVDGIQYKIRHDFGAGLTDYRFAYRNIGA